jgi:hypothetical protein
MRRLKPLLSILPLALSASTAMAADYRWTSSYDQGTLEATIWNRNASNIVIYCSEGQEDTTPGMFLEVKRIKPQRGESVTVQIVVDGDSFPFELNEIQFTASSRAEKWRFFALVDALVASKQKSFVVEFPKYDTSETFSLVDARKSLGQGKSSILSGCGENERWRLFARAGYSLERVCTLVIDRDAIGMRPTGTEIFALRVLVSITVMSSPKPLAT